jgi:hypothetical protein
VDFPVETPAMTIREESIGDPDGLRFHGQRRKARQESSPRWKRRGAQQALPGAGTVGKQQHSDQPQRGGTDAVEPCLTILPMNSIKVGDWVRIPELWPGIWMVYRTLSGFRDERWSLDKPLKPANKTYVFFFRLCNDSWQRSFYHESCEISLVRRLSPPDLKKLKALLSANPKLLAAFEKYKSSTKPINLVANIGFGGMNEEEKKEFPRVCAEMLADRIDVGLTIDDVLRMLRERGLDSRQGEMPQQATLQLTCVDHELRGDRFLYRRFRTLGF